MTISAFDVDSYNKPNFNFATAWQQGYRAGYIKLGGDNLSPRYRGTGYPAQFNSFAAQPFEHRGSYWVTGGNDPVASAKFYLANMDPRCTFDVLDNETLDNGRSWTDPEAAAFFDVLIAAGRKNLFQYGSRDSLWNTHAWPELEKRGIKAIVAIYNDTPLVNINPKTYPAELVVGHQFTSSANIGGLGAIDANAFIDDAFVGGGVSPAQDQGDVPMRYIHSANGRYGLILETGFIEYTKDGPWASTYIETATAASKLFNGIDVSDREYDIARQDALNRQALQAAGVSNVDASALSATVVAAINAALKGVTGSVDGDTVKAAVETAFAEQSVKVGAALDAAADALK